MPAGRALGRCEVVVYTPAHTGSLATLTEEERLLLAWAWRDRYEALYALPGVRFVMPFENRGEAVGVTLHHPHGQIYAYPFVPPVLERESQAFRERPVLLRLFPSLGPYVVDEEEGFLAFVPPSPATPLRSGWPPWKGTPVPGPSPRGDGGLRQALGPGGGPVRRPLWGALPYVMVFHAAPLGEEATFHFHVEFYPRGAPGTSSNSWRGRSSGRGRSWWTPCPRRPRRPLGRRCRDGQSPGVGRPGVGTLP